MRKVIWYLQDYQRKYFDLPLYLTIASFLIVIFIFNYYYDFEDSVIDSYKKTPLYYLFMFLWQAVPYLAILFIIYVFNKNRTWLTSGEFWFRFLLAFSLLAIDRAFRGHTYLSEHLDRIDYLFISRCIKGLTSLMLMVLPLLLIYRWLEKTEEPRNYYGLQVKRFDAKPYFTLLGIAVIGIAIGSFFSDLQAYYPRYSYSRGDQFAVIHQIPEWVSMVIYEFTYLIDFLSVELFFRGFLIFAFARTLGGYAVLAMVSTYAVLHFGKPLSEAISSVFGGYILGIVALSTRSIWGGVILHMGVAFAMEVFGYLQRLV